MEVKTLLFLYPEAINNKIIVENRSDNSTFDYNASMIIMVISIF